MAEQTRSTAGPSVVVAGGGIGGLCMALTCHAIGLPVTVLESVEELRPLGVGINLQPNAVRELQALGLGDALESMAVPTSGVNMYSKHGGLIWGEPRGTDAGYLWPQYSIHRGELQMLLYRTVVERLGLESVRTSARVTGYRNSPDGVMVDVAGGDGSVSTVHGSVLIAADGIHSAVRAQMFPDEGEPLWSGMIMWRGTTRAAPYLDGRTMVFCGNKDKMVSYPITPVDPETGETTVNWIASLTFDRSAGYRKEDYTREASVDEFWHRYDGWSFSFHDDVEGLVRASERIYEYPMVDRDPLPRWIDGNVTLMGDAAHVMYPVGSNGASQAIIDARKLGRAFLDHGVGNDALAAYEEEMRPATEKMILTNRSAGPDYIMEIVDERCGGVFDKIEDVIPHQELADFAARYKKTAGFSIADLNASPPTIPDGAKVGN